MYWMGYEELGSVDTLTTIFFIGHDERHWFGRIFVQCLAPHNLISSFLTPPKSLAYSQK